MTFRLLILLFLLLNTEHIFSQIKALDSISILFINEKNNRNVNSHDTLVVQKIANYYYKEISIDSSCISCYGYLVDLYLQEYKYYDSLVVSQNKNKNINSIVANYYLCKLNVLKELLEKMLKKKEEELYHEDYSE
jgi:hypothetical protein